MGPRAGLDGCEKSAPPPPNRIRSTERAARIESLYRLSHCGSTVPLGGFPKFALSYGVTVLLVSCCSFLEVDGLIT